MPDTHTLLLFIGAGWLLNLTPGPDVLCIVSHALRGGRRVGVAAALGVVAGCFVHVLGAALGLGVLLAGSALAFGVLKWAGAAYLFWMGARALLQRGGQATPLAGAAVSADLAGAFRRGFTTNVLNPKVVIFFLAFLPQFIAPDAANKTAVFLALGVIFNLGSLPVNLGWAWAAAWMAGHPAVQRRLHWLDRVAGLLFIGFGVKLLMSERAV
ncbi:LysE family translocator [Ideonella sp. 4Y11]|uniref:LysE family translocator n=1 Tax=Ideonella aquatica TaxID=2824119 RepID=A0A940YKZ1_9BURK|nr:LysE family translocator [Ideonella aquatica]MBQ0959764.1 LysE family translocator [Ideonella aquatica]